jgi:hypothetical protein
MQRLWESDLGLVVAGNFVYLPLLFDPSIARDLESHPPANLSSADTPTGSSPLVIEAHGSLFVKTVSLEALLENYACIHPEGYEGQRRAFLKDVGHIDQGETVLPDPKLAVILFQVMPYFLRRSRSFAREGLDPEQILRLLSEKIRVPRHFSQRTGDVTGIAALKQNMARLANQVNDPGPPPTGLMPARQLKQWFFQALTGKIAIREMARLAEALKEQEKWADVNRRHAGLLAYLAEKGSLEIDGFGFSRMRSKNEYRIYKRTGVYALKDFYGRPYIFPDCRVAVSTLSRLKPYVIEHYKHPLLRRHGPGQEICLPKDFQPSLTFSAANFIKALEAGINALYYGYNARRRNGYHSLDRIRQERVIDFDDYRAPPDDPKIVSGEIEIKNVFT